MWTSIYDKQSGKFMQHSNIRWHFFHVPIFLFWNVWRKHTTITYEKLQSSAYEIASGTFNTSFTHWICRQCSRWVVKPNKVQFGPSAHLSQHTKLAHQARVSKLFLSWVETRDFSHIYDVWRLIVRMKVVIHLPTRNIHLVDAVHGKIVPPLFPSER